MLKAKIRKVLILGTCFTLLSSGTAFASGGGIEPATLPDQKPAEILITDGQPGDILYDLPPDSPNRAVSYSTQGQGDIDDVILEKQKEINSYLFEEHRGEIKEMGFQVTHTGSLADCVEIGITPYNEENANYLYEIFGEEGVRVVEGQQARLLTTSEEAVDGVEVDLVMATDAVQPSEESSSNSILMYAIGVIAFIGGLIFVKHRKKTT